MPTGAGPGAGRPPSLFLPPRASAVSLMMDDPGPGGQGSRLLGPSAARGWSHLQGRRGLDCQQAKLDRGQAPGWWLWWAVRLLTDMGSPWWPGEGVFPGPSELLGAFSLKTPDGQEAVPERRWARSSRGLPSPPPPNALLTSSCRAHPPGVANVEGFGTRCVLSHFSRSDSANP